MAQALPTPTLQSLPGGKPAVKRSQGGYRKDIDGLRALAVVAVILNHLNKSLLPSGFLGVDIFFVISGYVITSSLANRNSENLKDFLLQFYIRRIKRLIPALVFCVVISGVFICLVNPNPGQSLITGAASLFGLSNLYLHQSATDYFGVSAELNPFTQTWSLGVEEQFYLIYPILAWFCCFGRSTPENAPGTQISTRRLSLCLGVLGLASLVLFLHLSQTNLPAAYFLMPSRFWELAAGCLLFSLHHQRRRQLSSPPGWWASVALILLLPLLAVPQNLLALSTPAAVLLTCLLIHAGGRGAASDRLLLHPSMQSIGAASYSLYLWHWSVLSLGAWTIGTQPWMIPVKLLLMTVLSLASLKLVEQPWRQARWSSSPAITLGSGLVASTAGAATLMALALPLKGTLYLGDRSNIQDPDGPFPIRGTRMRSDLCHGAVNDRMLQDCILPPAKSGRNTLMFIGDSHTDQLYPLIERLHQQEGFGLMTYTALGTRFPPQNYTHAGFISRELLNHNHASMAMFHQRASEQLKRGDVVVISSRIEMTFIAPSLSLQQRDAHWTLWDDNWEPTTQAKAYHDWLGKLNRLAEEHRRQGVAVVVVAPLPHFEGARERVPLALCQPAWFRLGHSPDCPQTFQHNRAQLISRLQPLRQGLWDLEARQPNLHIYDPFPLLCPASETTCQARQKGRLIFRDDNHLARDGALLLHDHFLAFLKQRHLAH